MIPSRPLSSSLTLWSGIFVMITIAFGWWQSLYYRAWFAPEPFFVGQAASYVSFGYTSDHEFPLTGFESLQAFRLPLLASAPLFLRGNQSKDGSDPENRIEPWERSWVNTSRAWGVFLPHWLLLTGTAALWSALLVMRARRVRRMQEEDKVQDSM